jgi:predicted secreted protein
MIFARKIMRKAKSISFTKKQGRSRPKHDLGGPRVTQISKLSGHVQAYEYYLFFS